MEKLQLADTTLCITASLAKILLVYSVYQVVTHFNTRIEGKAGKPIKAIADLGVALTRYKDLKARLEQRPGDKVPVPADYIALIDQHGQRALALHDQATGGATVDVGEAEKAVATLNSYCDGLHDLLEDLKHEELLGVFANLTAALKLSKQ